MTPSVLAVCHIEGNDSMYYYSTTFSGGPGRKLYSRLYIYLSSGGFDIPTAKCPPDRGSSDWVTDSLAPIPISTPSDRSSTLSSFGSEAFTDSIVYPPTPPPECPADTLHGLPIASSALRGVPIPGRHNNSHAPPPEIATPPLTPDDDFGENEASIARSDIKSQQNDALSFLYSLFPQNALDALPYAKRVSITSESMGATFDGVLLELPGRPKTFYVDGKSAAHVNLRESIVALLDLADESLECTALVLALEKASPVLGELLHSLMYVGGTVVTTPPFPVDPAYILVGLEL
ncbi:hypothetical protein EIP86_009087 [Pleurotus ostreatoroseus]|nr:hypothetical protein EIP86_009087 [Pleurotus ostreatoroseus]